MPAPAVLISVIPSISKPEQRMTQTIRNCENTRKTDSRQQGLEGIAVQICIDGTWLDVPAAALIDHGQVEQLAARCRAASSDPEFDIPDLLSLPDEARLALLKLINDLRRPYAIRVADCDWAFDNLFAVALHLAVDSDDIDRSSRSQQLAVKAAALMYPNSLELACQRIAARFRKLGVARVAPNQLNVALGVS